MALVLRHAEPWARDLLAHTPGVVIEGARQVGKSTLAAELARGTDAVIRTLDDRATREAALEDPDTFVAQGSDRLLVIDEIQRLPPLTLAIKAAIDDDRRPGRFLLTGSSSLLRVRGLADSMAGRIARLHLYGLSRGEVAGRVDDFAARAGGAASSYAEMTSEHTADDYVDLLAVGSFPELQDLPERIRNQRLDDYTRALVERDLPDLRKEVRPARALALLRALAGNQAGELVKAKLAEASAIPAGTITGYLDLLNDTGLVVSLPPWTPNLTKREIGRPKALVPDSGLAARLCRLSRTQLKQPAYAEAVGHLLEGFVVAELLKQQTWSAQEFELFHYRDRNGLEVDLVLELADGRVIAVEVKAASSFRRGQFAALRSLRDALGDRFLAGFVLARSRTGYHFGDRLYGAPVSALWD